MRKDEWNGKQYITYQDIELLNVCNNEYKQVEQNRKYNNELYMERMRKQYCYLLDNINGYRLDEEQSKVVLSEENNCLVIAGAGSGKTLTIIGKIRYLIEAKKIPQTSILCISFTNDTTRQLKQKLKELYGYEIEILTFHKLALKILKENCGKIQIAEDECLQKIVDNYLNIDILKEKEEQKWFCQHVFHIFYQNQDQNIKKLHTFPQLHSYFITSNYFIYMKQEIITFIHFMKANGCKNLKDWIQKSKRFQYWKTDDTDYLCLIQSIYTKYQKYLCQNKLFDFDDLIEQANELIKRKCSLSYQYIIIDEYQDTSYMRYQLIYSILKQTNSKILAVGDDFQSIYRFTGCNLDIFLNFESYFGKTEILKIQNTYRNSQQLIDIAGSFVMKNKKQMQKNLHSSKSLEKPIELIFYKEFQKAFFILLNNISVSNIFVLGRNQNDIKYLNSCSYLTYQNGIFYYQEKTLKFLTIHTSKGLEEDAIIVIHLADEILGFPSQIHESKLLNYIWKKTVQFPYEEERRLFYVAITRTKGKVYLMIPKKNPSIFALELKHDYRKQIKVEKI